MQFLTLRPFRKDNIHFRTIKEREKIIAYRLNYIDKMYSICKTFLSGAMKLVSLLFDQPT